MTVEVTFNDNVFKLTVTSGQPRSNLSIRLDMSAKRHSYNSLEGAQAKVVNSVLYHSVRAADIEADLYNLGGQLEDRIGITGAVRPSWQSQLVSAGRAIMAQGGGINVHQAIADAEANDPTILFGDYQVHGGRTYRVDNVAIRRLDPPNHCYPIAGPSLWSNVSQTDFAAIAALRRLEVAMVGMRGTLADKWRSMQHMDANGRQGNELWAAMTGARTQVRMVGDEVKNRLTIVSGRGDLVKALAALP